MRRVHRGRRLRGALAVVAVLAACSPGEVPRAPVDGPPEERGEHRARSAAVPLPEVTPTARAPAAPLPGTAELHGPSGGASPAAAGEPTPVPTPSVADVALHAPDPLQRGEAVGVLSLQRDAAAVEVLLEAARDPDPAVRHRSVEALRLAAADGLDAGGEVQAALDAARADPDPSVREAARGPAPLAGESPP